MIKKGFTLAELLVTLGIIGVIAAITLPGVVRDTSSAQIGPKLAKARSMFEHANQALLHGNNIDRLSDKGDSVLLKDQELYLEKLSDYMKISKFDDYYTKTQANYSGLGASYSGNCPTYLSADGVVYMVTTKDWGYGDESIVAHKNKVGVVWIDINGVIGPNSLADDVFCFQLMDDGSIQPAGSTFLSSLRDSQAGPDFEHWTKSCPIGTEPVSSEYCAGHIFENDLKVLYE